MIVPMFVHTIESFLTFLIELLCKEAKKQKKHLLSDRCVISVTLGKA